MVFGPDALLDHGGNYRHGYLAEGGDYVSAGATNAGRLTGGEIALARGWLQSETKRLVFHHCVSPRVPPIRSGTACSKALWRLTWVRGCLPLSRPGDRLAANFYAISGAAVPSPVIRIPSAACWAAPEWFRSS